MIDTGLYVIALYIRLSIEDIKVESLSIENQKIALHKFADMMEGVGSVEVLEFIDNGYSGTNFERPAVQQLLDDVRAGKVNCIIVKDFSRFGRNSIEVGYFMERVFPLYGIRFISINDDFDSDRYHGDTGGLGVAFKYLMAEFYSRDLSVKSKTAKLVKMRRGEYQSMICMYGYQKGANGRMEPDEETAPNVRLIFDLALAGNNCVQIARELFSRRIPTPGEYKASKGKNYHDISRTGGMWCTTTIMHILKDERYAGTYIIGKRRVTEVGSTHVRWKDESEWIKIPNHHPAIISKELFDMVQAVLPHQTSVKKNVRQYSLRHKVFCGCCHHAMHRNKAKEISFFCRFAKVDPAAPCRDVIIMEKDLEAVLYEILSKQASIILNMENLADAGMLDDRIAERADYGRRVENLKTQKRELYERLLLREITTEEYKARKAVIDKELVRLEQIYSALKTEAAQKQMDEETKNARRQLAQEITGTGGLTAKLAEMLIDRVYIYPGNQIDVEWKIKDFCLEG